MKLAALVLIPLLAACGHAPLPPERLDRPGLREIHGAYVDTVRDTLADEEVEWVHGWGGNARIQRTGHDGTVRGLCWEWQDLVHEAVAPVAARVGWRIERVMINGGWFSEHHAVAVWDPAVATLDVSSPTLDVFVLDPWRNGAPEIWPLAHWADTPWIVFEGLQVEGDPLEASAEPGPP